jgi:hypothetical protein
MDTNRQVFRRFNKLISRGDLCRILGFCNAKEGFCESFGRRCEIFLSRTQKISFHLLTSPKSSAMPSRP